MYCSQLLEMLKCTITSHLFLIEMHWLISEKVVPNMGSRLALQTCENCPSEIIQASMRRWKSNDHCTEKRLEGSELAAGCPLILSVDYPYLELHPQLWIQPDPTLITTYWNILQLSASQLWLILSNAVIVAILLQLFTLYTLKSKHGLLQNCKMIHSLIFSSGIKPLWPLWQRERKVWKSKAWVHLPLIDCPCVTAHCAHHNQGRQRSFSARSFHILPLQNLRFRNLNFIAWSSGFQHYYYGNFPWVRVWGPM
jgi:hypothetical protein